MGFFSILTVCLAALLVLREYLYTMIFQLHNGSKYFHLRLFPHIPVHPASVSTGRRNWRRLRGTTPSWRRLCSSPPQTSNSGNSSWRPIRRKLRGYTNGYPLGHCTNKRMVLLPCWDYVLVCTDWRFVGFVFQVTELECVSGQTTVIKSQKTELNQTIEELESALKAKEEVRGVCYARHNCVLRICILFHLNISCFCNYFQELERLKAEVESANEFQSQKDSLSLKLQVSYEWVITCMLLLMLHIIFYQWCRRYSDLLLT